MPHRHGESAGSIIAEEINGTVVLSVTGRLDAEAGAALLAALNAALEISPDRVDVDLVAVDDFTPEGLDALQACRGLSCRLAQGMHFRTVGGPGQAAFLEAFQ